MSVPTVQYKPKKAIMKLRESLLARCRAGKKAFASLGTTIHTKDGPLTHIDNGSNVLAVAHLDWVKWATPKIVKDTIHCPQLDDRLGVWTILDVLPYLGINVDVLLTDSEERGASTAQYFESPKEYNWMFQFDRAGTDVVMYEYETDEHEKLLKDTGFKVGMGSFSDICKLNHLKITGFNFGVGYHGQHTTSCYADLRETAGCVNRFQTFFNSYKDEIWPWVEDTNRWKRRGYSYYGSYDDYGYAPYGQGAEYYKNKYNAGSKYTGISGTSATTSTNLIPYENYDSYDSYYQDKFKREYLDLLASESGYIDGKDFMDEHHIKGVDTAIYELEYNPHLYDFNQYGTMVSNR